MTGSGPVRCLEARDGPGMEDSAGERDCIATLCGNCGNVLKKTQGFFKKMAPTAVGACLACSKDARCMCCREYREVERERARERERERERKYNVSLQREMERERVNARERERERKGLLGTFLINSLSLRLSLSPPPPKKKPHSPSPFLLGSAKHVGV
jgi:hypothetical protein